MHYLFYCNPISGSFIQRENFRVDRMDFHIAVFLKLEHASQLPGELAMTQISRSQTSECLTQLVLEYSPILHFQVSKVRLMLLVWAAYAQASLRQTSRNCICLVIYTILLIYDMIIRCDMAMPLQTNFLL